MAILNTIRQWIRSWKFPNDNFTLLILEFISERDGRARFGEMFKDLGRYPSIGQLRARLNRLEAEGYIEVGNFLLSSPPQALYRLTQQGRDVIHGGRNLDEG